MPLPSRREPFCEPSRKVFRHHNILNIFNSAQSESGIIRRVEKPLQLLEDFRARFGTAASVYRAPGRVNLIGEHTDYNDGFVLPAAIEFYCWLAAAPRSDRKLVIHSENFKETVEASLDSLCPDSKNHWANYPLGVAWALERGGKQLRGVSILINGHRGCCGFCPPASKRKCHRSHRACTILSECRERVRRRTCWHYGSICVLSWPRFTRAPARLPLSRI